METSDYYVSIPPRSSLYCTICTVDPNEIRDSSAKSYFHWKTLKCRYVISLMPTTVIASPIYKSKGAFYVITSKDFYKTGVLQRNLMKLNLKPSMPQIVTPRAYVDSLAYTFEFYMSPMWNKVAEIYMQGPNFLENSEFNSAMSTTINLISKETSSHDEIRIKLTALAAKLPPLKLEYLAIPSMAIGPFLLDPEGVLDVTRFTMQRVVVIPSMRKAIVKRVLKKIPSTCTFQNYAEIRRHWKNMYGYRLPKTDQGIIYYEVYFLIPCTNPEYFIYPDICIRREMSQRTAESADHLKQNFLQNLCTSMPTLLDQPLQISDKSHQQSHLQPENLQTLTSAMYAMNSMGFTTPFPVNAVENMANSTRLSLSGGPLKRETSTQMSPTPSLRGTSSEGDKKKLKFDNLKKIQQIHNSIPSSSFKTPKGGSNVQRPVKMFLNESEMSKYFINSPAVSQKRNIINIFSPSPRKKGNFHVTGAAAKGNSLSTSGGENAGEESKNNLMRSKVKIVSVSSGNYPWFG